jgi:rhomboid protease GluP
MPMTDARGQRFIPWVTIALAILNVGVFAIELAKGAHVVEGPGVLGLELGANYGPLTLDGEPWRLFTSMFLHVGIIHLAMNLILGLAFLGRFAELLYGRVAYVSLYLVSGLAGSLLSAMRSEIPSMGASGAIFGIMGGLVAYLIVHRKRIDPTARDQQIKVMGLTIAINVVIGLRAEIIDMNAHIGGLIGGVLVGVALEVGRFDGSKRLLRAVLVGVVGCAVVVGMTYAAEPRSSGLKAIRAFAPVEQKVLDRWNQIVTEIQSGKEVGDDEIASAIETEVLPGWRAAQNAYTKAGGKDPKMLEYIAIREDAWLIMLDALKASDPAGVQRGVERMKAADDLLRGLNGGR